MPLASNILASGVESTHYSGCEVLILTGVALDTVRDKVCVSAELTFG